MIASRLADLAITHHYTPDFKHEGNPFVLAMVAAGWGWTELIIAQAIGIAMITAGLFYWHQKPLITPYRSEIKNLWDFASYSYFGSLMSRQQFLPKMLYKKPQSWRYTIYMLCLIMPTVVILASAYIVSSWLMLRHYQSAGFIYFYNTMYPFSVTVPILFIAFFAQVVFFYAEYQKYLAANSHA